MTRGLPTVAWLGALLCAAGCGVARPQLFGDEECPDYEERVRPLVEEACGSCHGGAAPAGDYAVGEYAQTASRRWDGRAWVQPGVADSLFLRAARGEKAGHPRADDRTLARLEDWALRCRAAPRSFNWHEKGWLTPVDNEKFHGRYLRSGGEAGAAPYPFSECAECHGEDLKGGKTGSSCESCHAEGVTACNTCHGGPDSAAPPKALNGAWGTRYPGVGAHQSHAKGGALGKRFECELCHQKPKDVLDDGHWRKGAVGDVTLAEVALARSSPAGAAEYRSAEATCQNGYCHAPAAADSAATNRAPRWTLVGEDQAACGTCHGAPPAGHADDRCEVCHVPGSTKAQPDPATHVDFKLDLRGDGSDCSACHAPPDAIAFVDLHGRASPAERTVGAHEKHMQAGRFRGPMLCGECHKVPTALEAPGHIDSTAPAELFPSGGGLAFTDGAAPSWNPAAGTCANTYCHGAGSRFARDAAPNKLPRPVWTVATEQVVCGSCHGLPPQDGSVFHAGRTLADCATCHSESVDETGAIKFFVDPLTGLRTSRHLDGLASP